MLVDWAIEEKRTQSKMKTVSFHLSKRKKGASFPEKKLCFGKCHYKFGEEIGMTEGSALGLNILRPTPIEYSGRDG